MKRMCLLGALAVFLLGLALCSRIGPIQNPLRVPVHRSQQLLLVSNQLESVTFVSPRANMYAMLLALDSGTARPVRLAGAAAVADEQGGLVLKRELSFANLTQCSWLDGQGLRSYIVCEDAATRGGKWRLPLVAGKRYTLTVSNAPPGCSVWLWYERPYAWGIGLW
jgi:hypothetical protein